MENKINFLVDWLRAQVSSSGMNGLVVGISGGIDSAVVAHLCKRAFFDNSLGVVMPCKSIENDRLDAYKVIESCQIAHLEIDLTHIHNKLFSEIKAQVSKSFCWNEKQATLNDANLRARLRMGTIYSVASNFGYLVVGTDNAAEWHTGYFTKYGDGGVDLVPLLHLTKSEVRDMAKLLRVPDEVIYKAPSAGLWENQTDESELGTTYAMIDKFLKGGVIPSSDYSIIEAAHKKSEHKRRLAAAPPESFFQ